MINKYAVSIIFILKEQSKTDILNFLRCDIAAHSKQEAFGLALEMADLDSSLKKYKYFIHTVVMQYQPE